MRFSIKCNRSPHPVEPRVVFSLYLIVAAAKKSLPPSLSLSLSLGENEILETRTPRGFEAASATGAINSGLFVPWLHLHSRHRGEKSTPQKKNRERKRVGSKRGSGARVGVPRARGRVTTAAARLLALRRVSARTAGQAVL